LTDAAKPTWVLAIASGKGGTGKTTLAVNLAVMAARDRTVRLLDCDVEAPNCHIFVDPEIESSRTVAVEVPRILLDRCTHCGECARFCAYNAIAVVRKQVVVFPELCHACGGCRLVCPEDAIEWEDREVGKVLWGSTNDIVFTQGRLRVGEAMSPPLIREAKRMIGDTDLAVIDAPPGTSCPVITSVLGSDFVCLVTEPTPFGLNDLVLAVEMTRAVGVPMGVVINQADIGDRRVHDYCEREDIPLLAEIPFDRRIAEAYARGDLVFRAVPETESIFASLLEAIEKEAAR